jgi:diguanylate cyclase (GGDEF)-like protein
MAEGLLALSREHRQRGRARDAVESARQALTLAEEIGSSPLARSSWEQLAESQDQAGDHAGALASFRKFKEEDDRLLAQDAARRIEQVEQRYGAEKRASDAERLKSEDALRLVAANRRRVERYVIAGSTLLLALIALGAYRRRLTTARTADRLSVSDPLTGLKNRRYVRLTIGGDIAVAHRKRQNAPEGVRPSDADLTFMLIGLDRFKSVNDEFGHEAGDAMLEQVADVLRESCRASDTIARWGGDEFLVLSRFTDRRTGPVLAERVRSAIEHRVFELGDGKAVHRSCSLGYATFPFSPLHVDALSWEQVMAVADQAMRRAKEAGANRWVGVSASEAASAEQFRPRVGNTLEQWIADGTVTTESR